MMAIPVQAPCAILLMGVSGSGKSTIGSILAARLGWEFADADEFHPESNVEKMRHGVSLTDDDRLPWLHAIAAWIAARRAAGGHGVVTCSALKRYYRDILMGPDVRLVYLKGSEELIAQRLQDRHGHFMPKSLLRSQFETLEEPGVDEQPIIVDIAPTPAEIVTAIVSDLSNSS